MLTRFWATDTFHAYERATGDAPGTRSRLLAASTWQTRVVDLSADEATLWAGVRQSYHSLINKLERDEGFCIRETLPTEVIHVARWLHFVAAGRATRSEASWRLQASWVLAGHARGWLAFRDGAPVGFVYVLTTPPSSYYFSGAKTEDCVTHALLWHAMKALKASGVRWLELGWMARDGDTDKDRAVAFFKSGFGGVDVSLREVYGDAVLAGSGPGAGPAAQPDAQ